MSNVSVEQAAEAAEIRQHLFWRIAEERGRQDERWGQQNHPMTYPRGLFDTDYHGAIADMWKRENDCRVSRSKGRGIPDTEGCAWDGILAEEMHETFAETEPLKQAAEALQAAGVAVAILEYLVRTHPEVRELYTANPFASGESR